MGEAIRCVDGKGEIAKFFIYEIPGTGRVETIRVMWND
jgi:hypothetical protein